MEVTQILVFMTCLCLARDLVSCDDYKETGKDIILTPSIRGNPTEILWKHNENKVLEYDGSEVVEYGSFRGRVVVDFETGQLTIRKLNSQDSGQYQCDIVINGKVQTSSHTVTVLDALPEPQVTCELGESSNVKKLLCSVESRTQPSYEWSGPNINVQSGPELLVDEQEENRDSVYTCTVKNHTNSKSADFTLKDCPTGRAGSTVLVPVLTVTILIILILLILLAVFIYRRNQKPRLSEPNKMDPENGEDQNLLKKDPTEVITGSSDATLPSHNRLPSQKESIANKKWEQDNGSENSGEGQKLLKETKKLLEHNLKQSPESVSETNQENKENGNEGELDKNEKNSKSAVEPEENTCEKEKESHNPLQSQEEEEKEKSQMLKQESGDGEKSPEHQNERLEEQKTEDNNEDNQTPEETTDRRDTGEGQILLRNEEKTYSKPDEKEKESHKPLQSQEKEEKEKSQMLKQESGDGEKSPEHQNERLEEQKTEDNNEDNQTPEETTDRRDTDTETVSPQSAVTERKNMDTGNEEGQLHENEKKSQSDDGEQSPEQQNKNKQKTEDTTDSEDDMRPGEQKERSEEENQEEIDRANTDELCSRPVVDQPLDGEAPSGPADSPANLEKEPINRSASSSNQTDLSNYTDKEEERKRPGLKQDKEEMAVTNQEQKDGQKQMSEEKDHVSKGSEGKSSIDFDKQTDPDSTKSSVSQRDEASQDEAVKSEKSDMTDKDQRCKLIDDNVKVAEGETVQTQQEDGGDGGQRDMSSEPEQDMEEKNPPEMSQK